jgi:xanthine/CO dehydrogenase XdhC/CoxF family maturation factor
MGPLGRLICQGEINLSLEPIDARDKHSQLVAYRKTLARTARGQTALGRLKHIKIIGEGGDVHEAG